jgi:hypothetical protein
MIALACASHVLIDLPLFGAPVFLLVGAVLFTTRAERRRAASSAAPAPSGRSPGR